MTERHPMTPEQMTPTHVRERIIEIVSDWTDGKIEVPEDASALILIADYVDLLHEQLRNSIPKPVVEVYEVPYASGGVGYRPAINKYMVGELTAYPENAKREALHISRALQVQYDMTVKALGLEGGDDE